MHASDRGILKTDAEDQSQQVIQNPASEYQAAAYRNRDDPGEPFACQIGQGASGSAVERRENHRSPFRVLYGNKSFAQVDSDTKNTVSHRANALKALLEQLTK